MFSVYWMCEIDDDHVPNATRFGRAVMMLLLWALCRGQSRAALAGERGKSLIYLFWNTNRQNGDVSLWPVAGGAAASGPQLHVIVCYCSGS